MTINMEKTSDVTTLRIAGRLDTTTAPALDKYINENVADGTALLLDMKELEYISSAGLRVLLGAQKKMQKTSGMKLTNVCEAVMDVLEMTGFADILDIE